MKTLVLALLLAVPLAAQNVPKTIRPTKDESAQVKKHADTVTRMNRRAADLQKKQQDDVRTLLGIEKWIEGQHPGYAYDTTLDLFVEIPKAPPPAVEALKPEAKP